MARRSGRHASAPEHWTHRLAGLPWITLVLLLMITLAVVQLLRPVSYAAEAVMVTEEAGQARTARVMLDGRTVEARAEEAMELAPDLRGDLRITVVEDSDPLRVVVRAEAPDPRLAALAADTTVALWADEHGHRLESAAAVPTEPVRPRSLTWIWLLLVALALAAWVEGAHRVWLHRHPEAVAEGVR